MSTVNNNAGKFKLLCLNMTTASDPIDLSKYTVRMDIYESILSPGIIAELVIVDGTGIFSSFNNETICVSFTTYENAPPVHYKLKIIATSDGVSPPNEKSVVYTVTAVSEEVYKSANIKNLPLVRAKDILAGEAVEMMLNALETEKPLAIEKTTGLQAVSSAGIRPFDFIDQMKDIAVSEKHKASAYVFFENKNGYNFKSLEYMVEEGLKSIGDKVYIFHNVANIDVTSSQWRTILAAKQIQVGNESIAGLIGGNKNSSANFDVLTGDLEHYDKDVSSSFETVSMNENSSHIDTSRLSKHDNDGPQSVVIYDSSSDKHQVAEKSNYLPYYIAKFLTVIQHILVYGDSTVTLGDIITLRFPERTGLTTGNENPTLELDKNLSGNYMVCKMRHILIFAADNPTYYQAFEIVKDGLGGDSPKINA